MRKRESVYGYASIVLGLGGGGVLNWLGQSIWALIISIIFVAFGACLLIYSFRIKGKPLINTNNSKPDLIIGAKVNHISIYGYYEAFGGGADGDKKVILDLMLTPLKPAVAISFLALELFGNKYEAENINVLPDRLPLCPMVLQETISLVVQVNVPKQFAINSKEARIFALANGSECCSESFEIKFEDSK